MLQLIEDDRVQVPTHSGLEGTSAERLQREAYRIATEKAWDRTPSLPSPRQGLGALGNTGDRLGDAPYAALFATNTPFLEFVRGQVDAFVYRVGGRDYVDRMFGVELINKVRARPEGTALENVYLVRTPMSGVYDFLPRYPIASPLVSEPRRTRTPEPTPSVDANVALSELAQWTCLSPGELAPLLRASRRSIYNWLRGGPIRSSDMADRILHTFNALGPMRERLNGAFFRGWLDQGEPSPRTLIETGRWGDLNDSVVEASGPLRTLTAEVEEVEYDAGYGAETLRAVAQALRASAPAQLPSRLDWYPHELTGRGGSLDEEDD
jgi:hypothetical protein